MRCITVFKTACGCRLRISLAAFSSALRSAPTDRTGFVRSLKDLSALIRSLVTNLTSRIVAYFFLCLGFRLAQRCVELYYSKNSHIGVTFHAENHKES